MSVHPLHFEGGAVVIDGSERDDAYSTVRPAVMMLDGALRLVQVRRLKDWAAEDAEARDIFVRTVCLRRTLEGAGAPRLIDAYGDRAGHIEGVVEERTDGLRLRQLSAALNAAHGATPIGLVLYVARCVIRPWLALERLCVVTRIGAEPDDVHVDWHGGVLVEVDVTPGWNEQSRGAMVGMLRGSFEWMPPEVAMGRAVTSRAFMFSLAVLLLELLAGKHPYEQERGRSNFALLEALVRGPLPRATSLRRDVPPLLDAIVERCGRHDASERFSSWSELDAALADAADRLEPFGAAELAAILANLMRDRRDAVLELDEQIAMLRFDELSAGLAPPLDVVIPLAPTAPQPDELGPAWEEPTEPFVDINAWGRDARPMVRLGPLLVDARPVSNAEYARFTIATSRVPPVHWAGPTPPQAFEDDPVTHVTHEDALAYAAWAEKRLPTTDEWQRSVDAAGDRRLGTGAVWEWTASGFSGVGHVVRGGRWRDRQGVPPVPANSSFENEAAGDVGFRCVADEGRR